MPFDRRRFKFGEVKTLSDKQIFPTGDLPGVGVDEYKYNRSSLSLSVWSANGGVAPSWTCSVRKQSKDSERKINLSRAFAVCPART